MSLYRALALLAKWQQVVILFVYFMTKATMMTAMYFIEMLVTIIVVLCGLFLKTGSGDTMECEPIQVVCGKELVLVDFYLVVKVTLS